MQPLILPVTSCANARDLGGYPAFDGKHIRQHKLIRAGMLGSLSSADAQYLSDYGLKILVDLRSPKEAQVVPDKIPAGSVYVADSIFPKDPADTSSDIVALRAQYAKDPLSGFQNMLNTYKDMVRRPSSQAAFARLLQLLVKNDQPQQALLYHCNSGKDRTGLATVFILTLLGVDPELIRQDYLYSNYLLHAVQARRDDEVRQAGGSEILRATVRSLASVANEYLDAALLLIDSQYGGMQMYLEKQLKVTAQMRAQLQGIYLVS